MVQVNSRKAMIDGRALQMAEEEAARGNLSFKDAVNQLILRSDNGVVAGTSIPALVNLEAVSTDDIIDELVGRLQQLAEHDAVVARAEAAEAKLAIVAEAIGGTRLG